MSPIALIVPGINDSGPEHWQSIWQKANPGFERVRQRDWNHAVCREWVHGLEQAVTRTGPEVVLIAHSLGCLAVVHWAAQTSLKPKAAMLVAPPDPAGPNFPEEATGFAPLPMIRMAFPSVVVASTNDPYSAGNFARHCASAWGSDFIDAGPVGHINAASGLGDWPGGYRILEKLIAEYVDRVVD